MEIRPRQRRPHRGRADRRRGRADPVRGVPGPTVLGNARLAPCSAILKQRPARAWLNEHADPADTILYVGIDWSETRRIPAIERGWAPWTVRFPVCDPPRLSKQDMLDVARDAGLEPPRLYELGFSHIFRAWRSCLDNRQSTGPAALLTCC